MSAIFACSFPNEKGAPAVCFEQATQRKQPRLETPPTNKTFWCSSSLDDDDDNSVSTTSSSETVVMNNLSAATHNEETPAAVEAQDSFVQAQIQAHIQAQSSLAHAQSSLADAQNTATDSRNSAIKTLMKQGLARGEAEEALRAAVAQHAAVAPNQDGDAEAPNDAPSIDGSVETVAIGEVRLMWETDQPNDVGDSMGRDGIGNAQDAAAAPNQDGGVDSMGSLGERI